MKLSNTAKKILNDPVRIEHRDMWMSRLQDLYDGKSSGYVMAINGVIGFPDDAKLLYSDPEQWVIESLEILADQIDKCDSDIQFVPPCIEPMVYGVHFIDNIFGAHVYYDDDVGQWYNDYLDTDVGTLKYPDLEKSEAWNIAILTANTFLEQDLALPLFGLPTIASALVVSVNLYGENILTEMLVDPENAIRDFCLINELLVNIHRYYRSRIPEKQHQPVISWNRTQPPGYGQLCGCTSQLVSAEAYNTQIAGLDNELLGVYPKGGMMHLCGRHTQHIPAFKAMPKLKAIQINDRAAHDLEIYFNDLREDQIIYLNPCQGMPVDKAMDITGGKRLVIADTIESPIAVK